MRPRIGLTALAALVALAILALWRHEALAQTRLGCSPVRLFVSCEPRSAPRPAPSAVWRSAPTRSEELWLRRLSQRQLEPSFSPGTLSDLISRVEQLEYFSDFARFAEDRADGLVREREAAEATRQFALARLVERQRLRTRWEATGLRAMLHAHLDEIIRITMPNRPYLDEALFLAAEALCDEGRWREAERALREFVDTYPWPGYPPSVYVPRAWALLGDLVFSEGHDLEARDAYGRAFDLAGNDAAVRRYAQYRLAWVWARLGEREVALRLLAKGAEDARAEGRESWRAVVVGDASAVALVPPTRVEPARLLRMFGEVASSDGEAMDLLDAVAVRLARAGRWPEAEEAFHLLGARAPMHRRACAWRAAEVRVATCAAPPEGTPTAPTP